MKKRDMDPWAWNSPKLPPNPRVLRPSCINKTDLDDVVEPTVNMSSIPLLHTDTSVLLSQTYTATFFYTQSDFLVHRTQYNPIVFAEALVN